MENNKEKGVFVRIYEWFKNLTVKGLLGVILMAFVIIIILMSVSYIPKMMSRISNSLSAALYSVFVPTENATMTTDRKIISSGEDFNINFKRGDLTDGFFTVSYGCDSPVELVSVETNGLKKISCDTPYYLLDNETSIKIRSTTQDSVVRLVVTGSFENNENQKIETVGVARVTIKNDTTGTVVNTSNISTTPVPTNSSNTSSYIAPIYYGKADLATRILQTGKLNPNTNLITSKTNFVYSDMVGLRFEVRNDGDANTGPWSFTAVLPSLSTPIYNSNMQVSLRPGESIIFTIGFSNLTNVRTGLITVNIDPQNMVAESAEYNNIITSTITNSSYNSNYYDDYYEYNYNYNDLEVDCYADPEDPETGDRVRWYVDVDGGDGDYNYDWTGTNGLDSSSKNPSKTYSSTGTKRATVTVTDGDDNEATASCSVRVSN
jgi:hypothetical protein